LFCKEDLNRPIFAKIGAIKVLAVFSKVILSSETHILFNSSFLTQFFFCRHRSPFW